MSENAGKIGWTVILILTGWMLIFIPTAEDGVPDRADFGDRNFWTVWIAINIIALVAVHIWVSEDERKLRKQDRRRRQDYSMRNHPTRRHG